MVSQGLSRKHSSSFRSVSVYQLNLARIEHNSSEQALGLQSRLVPKNPATFNYPMGKRVPNYQLQMNIAACGTAKVSN
ncbi:unnamed protein product [Ilex paraguariensis]|uniref:Uncharacterized protein n=1 Tax=Ilex paraguariensis TaxID=185542 RepID=A0ABC8UAL3_9AQUA